MQKNSIKWRRCCLWVASALLVCSCRQSDQAVGPVNLKQDLPGLWITSRIEVNINSLNGQDSSVVEVIEEATWRNRFSVHPPEYYFSPDQQFRREHRSLADTLISSARGLWNAFSDTLMLIEPDGTYQYIVSFDQKQVVFSTTLDWDGDGEADDAFKSWNRLLRKIE